MNRVFYFSDWSDGISCMGPPTSMYIIESLDLGTPAFQWVQSTTNIQTCGRTALPLNQGCCIGSYDLKSSVSASMMTSAIPMQRTSESLLAYTPNTAIGSKYCLATYRTKNGFSLTKYVLDDGICRENWKCENGELKISNSTRDCMGDGQEILLDATYSSILDSVVQMTTVKIEQGYQRTLWNGFYPSSMNVIYANSPASIVGVIFISLIMLFSVLGSIKIVQKIRMNPQQKQIYVPVLFGEVFSIAASISTIVFYFVPQSDERESVILTVITKSLQGLSSFIISWNNLKILLAVLDRTSYTSFLKGREYLCFVALTILHLSLAWTMYFSFLIYDNLFIFSWNSAGAIWIGVSLLGNFMCLIIFVYYQLSAQATKGSNQNLADESSTSLILSELYKNKKQFYLLLLLFFNIIWFFVCYGLASGLALKNDKSLQYFQLFLWMTVPFNGYLSVVLFGATSKKMKSIISTNANGLKNLPKKEVVSSMTFLHKIFSKQNALSNSKLQGSQENIRSVFGSTSSNLNEAGNSEQKQPPREKIGLVRSAIPSSSTPDIAKSSELISSSNNNAEIANESAEKPRTVETVEAAKAEKPKSNLIKSWSNSNVFEKAFGHVSKTTEEAVPGKNSSKKGDQPVVPFKETGVKYTGQKTSKPFFKADSLLKPAPKSEAGNSSPKLSPKFDTRQNSVKPPAQPGSKRGYT